MEGRKGIEEGEFGKWLISTFNNDDRRRNVTMEEEEYGGE